MSNTDEGFIVFQDKFYDLLEEFGVKEIDCEHKQFNKICKIRDVVFSFIEREKTDV